MDTRLKKYCDLNRFFLDNIRSLQDCLLEANKTQNTLIELIELKSIFDSEFNEANRSLEKFLSEKRVSIKENLDKNSVKNVTREVIEDRVKAIFPERYLEEKQKYDEAKLNMDLCNELKMVMFQRKDLLCHTMDFLTFEKDRDSCILNSSKFVDFIMGKKKP